MAAPRLSLALGTPLKTPSRQTLLTASPLRSQLWSAPTLSRPMRHIVAGFREDRASIIPTTNGTLKEPENNSDEAKPHTVPTTSEVAPVAAPPPPAAVQSATAPTPQEEPGFKARRLLVFAGLVLGYSAYYLTRNSLTYTAPVMVADPSLGFSLAQVGTMTSIFPIAYGMSKFVAGVLGDRFSAAVLLGGGLIATAACNIALGAGSGLAWFATMWAANGLIQGVGAPACARMLTSWFAASERGTFWGLWNVAHNMGGFLSPLVAASAAHAAGWRWGMWAPGLVGLLLGAFVLVACRDTPQDAGFKPVEQSQQKKQQQDKDSASASGEKAASKDGSNAESKSVLRTAIDNVLSNPCIWALALSYFFVYVVRQGITSWTVFYLINEKGVPDAAQAAVRVSGLELGGLLGGLAAGRLSDVLIRRAADKAAAAATPTSSNTGAPAPSPRAAGSVGLRVKVVMLYTAALAGALAVFQALPASAPPAVQWASVAAIGFCIYGPQMLIGLCGAELVHPASVGASQGVLGWVAYLGAANAGLPLSHIITRFGWSGYFGALMASCGAALLLLAPMAGLSSFTQRLAHQQQGLANDNGNANNNGNGGSGGHLKVA